MQAIDLIAPGQLALRKVARPTLRSAQDALIRIGAVGVCGSDVHYYRHGRIGSQIVEYPFRVGHECAGEVLAVGADVKRVAPGDRVAIEPAIACGTCDQCRAARPHTCRHLQFLGCPGQREGCLCEELVMPADCCFPLPPQFSLELGALVEPLSIGLYAVRLSRQRQALPTEPVVGIQGAGPIGLSVLLALRDAAPDARIFVSDPLPARQAVARAAGAIWSGAPGALDGVVAAEARLGLDTVFECCGEQAALDQAVALMKPGGMLMVVGIPTADRVAFASDTCRRREIGIQHVRRQNHCMQAAIDGLATGRLPADFMITHRWPFARTPDAFDQVAAYADGVIKAMIVFQ